MSPGLCMAWVSLVAAEKSAAASCLAAAHAGLEGRSYASRPMASQTRPAAADAAAAALTHAAFAAPLHLRYLLLQRLPFRQEIQHSPLADPGQQQCVFLRGHKGNSQEQYGV